MRERDNPSSNHENNIKIPQHGTLLIVEPIPNGGFVIPFFYKRFEKKCDEAEKRAQDRAVKLHIGALKDRGILGDHKLLAKGEIGKGMWGSVKGEWTLNQFLFFTHGEGYMKGHVRTGPSYRFAWSPKPNQLIITELPLDKVIFEPDKDITDPTITFDLNDDHFVYRTDLFLTIGYHVKFYSNPNDYIREDRLDKAVIKIPTNWENSTKLLSN